MNPQMYGGGCACKQLRYCSFSTRNSDFLKPWADKESVWKSISVDVGIFTMHLSSILCMCFRPYLDVNVQQWRQLHLNLQDLLIWLQQKQRELNQQKPVGSDIPTLQQQQDKHRVSYAMTSSRTSQEQWAAWKRPGTKWTVRLGQGRTGVCCSHVFFCWGS